MKGFRACRAAGGGGSEDLPLASEEGQWHCHSWRELELELARWWACGMPNRHDLELPLHRQLSLRAPRHARVVASCYCCVDIDHQGKAMRDLCVQGTG